MRYVSQEDKQTAIKTLRKGGILGVPTETVYGLAVAADNTEAIKKLLNEKQVVDIQGERFNVNNIIDSRECLISSRCFNMSVISILVKCFGITKWNWKCLESE